MACNGGELCECKKIPRGKHEFRPNIYSNPLPPYPTIEEIKKAVRDELKKAGVI